MRWASARFVQAISSNERRGTARLIVLFCRPSKRLRLLHICVCELRRPSSLCVPSTFYITGRMSSSGLLPRSVSSLGNVITPSQTTMQIPVCMYHGSPEERAELRRTVLALPRKHESLPTKKPARKKNRRLSRRDRGPGSDEESVTVVEGEDSRNELNPPDDDDPNPTTQLSQFPVVITTYEMIIKDRIHLAKYGWGQVIVD